MPLNLYVKGTDKLVIELSDRQFQNLRELLVDESPTDRDYYIDDDVLAYLEEKGGDKALVAALRHALGTQASGYREHAVEGMPKPGEGIDVEWREE